MIKKLNRRQFIRGTGLASGTLMLGVQFSPLMAQTTQASPFAPDVFVSMDANGQVTIISHRSEMGQGIRSTLPKLVADEMDAAGLQNFATAAGGNDPVETAAAPEEDYRTFVILPKKLIIKLRKIAVHRGLIENQLVTVNDIISRILRTEFARSGE